jgi:phage terminase large subunit-like protein
MRSTEALPRFVCPDWWDKIQAGRTPMPAVPLNEARAAKALAFFNRLRLPDVAGNPRLAEACGDWFRDILCAFLASEDPVTKRRLVWELLCMVSKKNGRERETRRWLSWSRAWCHEGVLERRQSIASRLRDFQAAGELTIYTQAGEDIAAIVELIADVKQRGLLAAVVVDPAGLGEMVEALDAIDVTVENKLLVGAPQGYGMMNAIKTAERKTPNKTLQHAPSSLMDWCVGNVKIEPMATAIRATKQNAGDAKIDPWAALMNGVWMMSRNPEARGHSGWNTDDLDGLIAKIDAVVDAMGETGDADSGRQVLQGVGRPA